MAPIAYGYSPDSNRSLLTFEPVSVRERESTGSLCLPPAFAGRIVMIGNGTSNGLNLFGSNTPVLSGTQDTINGTTGSTANTTVLPSARERRGTGGSTVSKP